MTIKGNDKRRVTAVKNVFRGGQRTADGGRRAAAVCEIRFEIGYENRAGLTMFALKAKKSCAEKRAE